jgi:thiol-disulfide isomerase/thioredoxin
VEFFGYPVYSDISDITTENITSQYDLWFNNSDALPYRLRRKMPHNISWEAVSNTKIDKNSTGNVIASKYFPPGFSIEYSGVQKAGTTNLEGKAAPALRLKDFSGHEVYVNELNCKIIMLQFTGVGCGPCHSAIPFLKQLDNEYNDEDLILISIETWSKNISGIKRYIENNEILYQYFLSTEDVKKGLHVGSVPAFYILDEKRVIRKIINGYKKGTTDKEIRDVIKGLL